MSKNVLMALSYLMLSACSSDPYQGLYEGIKSQNEAKRSPQEKAMTPAPSYDTYKNEREKITP
ncbi:MAG: hypothetical protein WCI39_05525 [Gallionellaceae bacterium]